MGLESSKKFYQYRKIPKISPSKYKPPKPMTQKTFRSIASPPPPTPCPNCKLPGGLYFENCPQIQSKTKQKR